MRTLRIYSQQPSYITCAAALVTLTMLYVVIPSANSFCDWKFVPFDHHYHVATLPTPLLGTANLISSSMSLFVFAV